MCLAISVESSRESPTALPAALTLMVASTACGSTFWSKSTNIGVSRRCGPEFGQLDTTCGGGVSKVKVLAAASVLLVALRVPAGIST